MRSLVNGSFGTRQLRRFFDDVETMLTRGPHIAATDLTPTRRRLQTSLRTARVAIGHMDRRVAGNDPRLDELKRQVADLEESKRLIENQNEDLRHRATIDQLSGLLNRHAFFESARTIYAACRHSRAPVSCLMFDIDHFKCINDTYGHQAGDRAIAAAARILHNSARASDIACRYGGEEFVILSPATDATQALQMAERVRSCIEIEVGLSVCADMPIKITISVGVASDYAESDVETIIGRADCALYGAKREGRNQVRSADDSVDHGQRSFTASSAD